MKANKILFMLAVLSLALFGCQSPRMAEKPAQRETAGQAVDGPENKKPHLVFFIHGYLDNGSTFVDFPKILGRELAKDNVRVFVLKYPSVGTQASPWLNVFDFAKAINAQIISTFVEQGELDRQRGYLYPVDANTTYTIIAHSQGGLVTMNYLNTCLSQNLRWQKQNPLRAPCAFEEGVEVFDKAIGSEKPADFNLHVEAKKGLFPPRNFRNFVSLGSPFWGSGVINGLMARTNIKGFAKKRLYAKLPWIQAENLAIGGVSASLARIWLLNRESDETWTEKTAWKSRYPESVRVFNLSGYIGDSAVGMLRSPEWLLRIISAAASPALYETDFVVPIPESSSNYFYSIENSRPGQSAFQGRTDLPQVFLPLKMIHGNVTSLPSLSTVREGAAEQHASYQLVKAILEKTINEIEDSTPMDAVSTRASIAALDRSLHAVLERKVPNAMVERVKNFTNEIKLITPIGYHRGFGIRDENVAITSHSETAFEAYRLEGGPLFRTYGTNTRAIKLRHNYYQTYYHIGEFKEGVAWHPRQESYSQFLAKNPDGFALDYRVSVLGFEAKSFAMKTLAGSTSYAEVYLTPRTVFKDEPLGKLSIPSIGKQRALQLDSNKRLVAMESDVAREKSKSARASKCHIGVRGLNTPDESDVQRQVLPSQNERLPVNHQGRLYLQASDPRDFAEADFEALGEGETVEIFGRYTQGFRDPATQVVRPCLKKEADFNPENCVNPTDRYLVSSLSIRQLDKITPKEIGTPRAAGGGLNGLRWIDVVDVDAYSDKALAVNKLGKIVEIPATACLLGRDDSAYPSTTTILNTYYRRD